VVGGVHSAPSLAFDAPLLRNFTLTRKCTYEKEMP